MLRSLTIGSDPCVEYESFVSVTAFLNECIFRIMDNYTK